MKKWILKEEQAVSERLKLGVMGLRRGAFALVGALALKEEVVVTAVCEMDEASIEEARECFAPETKVYTDYDAFLASGLDAVILCNYFHEHTACAIKALDAGIAVLSETTAAATLGECVDLVEAVERNNGRYMLAANCPYFKAVHAMKEKIGSGEYGPVRYAEAEYIHPYTLPAIDYEHLHWRQAMPNCYYNMHTLGPLMYITQSMPVRVIGKSVNSVEASVNKATDMLKSFALTEMDNGAVFNTTGCVNFGPVSKWYRVACQEGTLETVRYDSREEYLLEVKSGKEVLKTQPGWSDSGCITPEEEKKYYDDMVGSGHGGIDFVMLLHFVKFLKGEEEIFFDVYKAVALSAAGILTWYSVLDHSKEYEIPDFRDKAAREVFRGDYRTPIKESYKDMTLPCSLTKRDFAAE